MKICSIHKLLLLALALLAVASCNLFNPSGTTTVDKQDADALIAYAQKLYRQAAYADAAENYRLAIAADSTKSEAYFGLAKAGMRNAGANPMEILKFVGASDAGALPFMNEAASFQNMYYRSMTAVDTALSPLIHRDTLTEFWEYSVKADLDPTYLSTLADSLEKSVTRFRTNYKHGTEYTYGPNNEKFPLSDRKYKYDRFRVDYTLASFSVMLLGFLDFNGDGFINEDDIPIKISRDSNGNLSVDVSEVISSAMTNPKVAQTLNDNIDKLADGSGNLTDLVASMAGNLGLEGDSAGSQISDETKATIDSQISDMGEAARFYKLGDKKDNDGDGCVDEEVFDSTDNDYDGFIDEDLRMVLNPLKPGIDVADNDVDGAIDEADEFWSGTIPDKDANGVRALPFITSNSADRTLKVNVVKDKTGTAFPLAARIAQVGGCWGNYNATTFQAYLDIQNQ